MTGPSEYPVLMTPRERQAIRNGRPYHVCSVCKLTIAPRNGRAHYQACARRKRLDPALWTLWYCDMHQIPETRRDKMLGPARLAELRERGHLPEEAR